ncbi:MAG TPA: flagellar biosynthesis protein FliO, partial [Afipia sp.]|nr:flagellar biosynthesis protein FliO [Afipia sp.]
PPPLPPRPPARPAADPSLSSADQNLADMAQRLEAALRRPGGEPRLDTAPSIGPVERPGAPPVAPEPMGNRPAPRSEGAPRPPVPPAPPPPPTPKAAFENLEDEMANLLGRPKPPA